MTFQMNYASNYLFFLYIIYGFFFVKHILARCERRKRKREMSKEIERKKKLSLILKT
jgi:hypothetical protein